MLSMIVALFGLTSCEFYIDSDQSIGYDVSGHWFGDLDMWVGNEKARGSEIEFIPSGWGYSYGRGIEVDYYYRGTVTHYFNYEIRNGVIYLTFDDPNLDCSIWNYSLGYNYFRGYIADVYGYNQTYFSLRSYDRYWNDYGYGGYYYAKENTMDDIWNDSTATDTLNITTRSAETNNEEKPFCIRGVNRGIED